MSQNNFSPEVNVLLSDTNCGFIGDLTIDVAQDPFEVDMDTAVFLSDGGSFNISSLTIGDNIGLSTLNLSLSSFSADLIVSNIVSSNEISVDAIDQLTGANLGSFMIKNLIAGGIEIIAFSPDDGNNFTNGLTSTVTFNNLFENPQNNLVTFTSSIVSELGDLYFQSNSQQLFCLICNINLLDSSNISCYGGNDGFISVQGSGAYNSFAYSLQVFDPTINSWAEIANSPLSGTYTSLPVTFPNLHSDSFLVIMTDSLVCLDTLEIFLDQPQLISTIFFDTACGEYLYNGLVYDSTGIYYDTLTSTNGCDSIIQLEIFVFQDSSVNYITSCDSVFWEGTWYYSTDTIVTTGLTTTNSFGGVTQNNSAKEGNFWYFGYGAGLDFNSGNPTTINNGQLNTLEGCATIADNNGNLLFYTDGSVVYNSQHNVMQNGTGLLGNSSSTQSAIIVKKPGSSTLYYIFTVDGFSGNLGGLNYSVVDMTLDGGLGAVNSNKNIPLITNTCEKVTAIVHNNGSDFWIISREENSDTFFSFLLTPAGVNTSPVISSAYSLQNGTGGYLKGSPDGTKIAACYFLGPAPVEVYDFDNQTGVLSNPITSAIGSFYGLEFSPNSEILYVSDFNNNEVYQFDLNSLPLTHTVIGLTPSQTGAIQLASDNKIYVVSYNLTTLDVINYPNILGSSCDYVNDAVNLSGTTGIGLPTFFSSIFNSPPSGCDSVSTTIITVNQPTYDTTYITANDNYFWGISGLNYTSSGIYSFLDTNLYGCNHTYFLDLIINISGCTDPLAINYNSLAVVDDSSCIYPCSSSSVSISVLDSSNISCFGFNDGYLQLDASGALDNFNYQLQLYDSLFSTWITVGQTPFPGIYTSNPILFPNLYSGCYRVIVTDSLLCSDTVSTCLTQPSPITFDVIISNANNVQNNNGSIEIVNVSGGNYSYVFSGFDQNSLPIISNANLFDSLQSGLYTVTVTDSVGCFLDSTVQINHLIPGCTDVNANNYNPLASIDDSSCCYLNFYDENIVICLGDTVELLYSNFNSVDSSLWSSGSTQSSLFVSPNLNTTYWLTQYSNGFSCSDTVNVIVSCLDFSPSVSVSLSNLNCGLTDLTISVSQDSNEVDMDTAIFVSDFGSFTINTMVVGDNIGSASMSFGANSFNTDLIVNNIFSNQIIVEAIDQLSGLTLGTFSITNLVGGGVEIIAVSPGDGNSYTNGNISSITFTNVFDSPSNGFVTFTSSIISELNDIDIQTFPFTLSCIDFSPDLIVSLSDLNCGAISDLTITVSQDSFEVDIDTAIFISDGGYFNISSMSVGDNIGSATMTLSLSLFNADLIVSTIVSTNQILVDAIDQLTGANLGTFTITNLVGGGIEIIAISPDDGNFYTLAGNLSSVFFDSVFVNSSSGLLTFTATMISEQGDVSVQTSSFFINSLTSFFTISRCETYSWNGNVFDSTGIYVDTFLSIIGCDSIVTLDLTIYNITSSFDTLSVCDGILWNGVYLDSSGQYLDTLINSNGCDSLVNLDLTINSNSSYNFITSCDNYQMNGIIYDSSGVYIDTLTNSNGCDSVVTIDLTINYSSTQFLNITACGYYLWDSIIYDSSGVYIDTLVNSSGCDSVVTIDLIVNNITTVFDTVVACDTLFWNGNIYTTSGNYIDTVLGNSGCDSIVNLNLTINQSSTSTNFITACDNYIWFGQTLSSSGIYDTILQNSIGCDSLTQIYLTIIPSVYQSVNLSSCGPFDWNGNVYDTTGVYYDTLPAINGCDSIITLNLLVTPIIEISSLIVNVDCFGNSTGAIDLEIINGTSPYLYQWSNNSVLQDINSLLGDSIYSCSITDSAGCSFDTSFYVSQPSILGVSEAVVDVSCFGGNDGSITLNIFGGVSPYTVDWGSIDTFNLFVGFYSYVVTDENGCVYLDSVEVNQPNEIQINVNQQDISCFGYDDGSIEVNVIAGSGIPGFTYDWVGPNLFSANTNNIYNLFAGDYYLTITDANGCILDTVITLNQPANIPQNTNIQISNYSGYNIRCKGDNSGWVSVQVTGGYEPYTYLWSNLSSNDSIYDLYAGTYTLEVTDSLGCVIIFDFPLIEPAEPLTSSIIQTTDYNGYNVSCYSFNDAALQAVASGGVPNYDYYWNGIKLTDSIFNLTAGQYQLTVYDKNDCESISFATLIEPDSLFIEVTSFTDTCSKGVGRSEISTFGGVSPFSYQWSNGLSSSVVSNFNEGIYGITVIDVNLCEVSDFAQISNLPSPIIDFGIFPDNQRLFDQLDDPIVFVDFTNGIWQDIDSWIWDYDNGYFGSDSISYHSFSDTGTYNIMLTTISEYNCIDTLTKKLTITDYNLYIPNSFTPFSIDDNLNETFRAYGIGIKTFKMEIYNRWGQRIFSSESIDKGWDGTLEDGNQVPVGIYLYSIESENIYGEIFKYQGQIKLLR